MTAPRPTPQEVYEDLTGDQREALRNRCKSDLYFLAKGVLSYNQVTPDAHAALCAFMTRSQSKRREVLMPRGHLKTTLCTISDSIRLSLIDPDNCRILIQNEVFDNASDMLVELEQHWTSDGMLPKLFPELVPEHTRGPGADWSKRSASLPPRAGKKDSTYTASGSGGSPQSKHFTHLKCDDLIGEKAKESAVEMEKAIRWTDAMEPLLDSLDDQIDLYGTRKTIDDVYKHFEDDLYPDEVEVFIREPIENGLPIFPSKYSLKRLLNIMRTKPEVWAHDFMNNPIGRGGRDWSEDYVKTFRLDRSSRRVWLKPSGKQLVVCYQLSELDVVVLADPNKGNKLSPDRSAVQAHGVTPNNDILVLEAKADRWSPSEFVDQIWELAQQWHPRVVGIEDQGNTQTVFYFGEKCKREDWYYRIQPLRHNKQSKEVRIRNMLDTPLRAGRVYMLEQQLTLRSAISFFPQLAKHNWDEIDCMSFGPEVYRAGVSAEDIAEEEEAEARVLSIGRGVTGYGASV